MLLALPSANNKQQVHSHAHTIVEGAERWGEGGPSRCGGTEEEAPKAECLQN